MNMDHFWIQEARKYLYLGVEREFLVCLHSQKRNEQARLLLEHRGSVRRFYGGKGWCQT